MSNALSVFSAKSTSTSTSFPSVLVLSSRVLSSFIKFSFGYKGPSISDFHWALGEESDVGGKRGHGNQQLRSRLHVPLKRFWQGKVPA